MIINVKTSNSTYDIVIEKNSLDNIEKYLDLNHKVLVLTDDGIPNEYVEKVINKCRDGYKFIIKQGENSKNFTNFQAILKYLIENNFTRNDVLISLGGGVVGDLGGFVSSTFMRGITFYNLPTSLLAQVDSSIGGKTAIDMEGYKNIVGTFYPPHKVIIDPLTLKTLDKRQLHAGLMEVLKMGLTHDEKLVSLIENSNNLLDDSEKIIIKALLIKKSVVENDEKENGNRRVLNFGHTIGHCLESYYQFKYLHGECVANGILYFANPDIQERIKIILAKYKIPLIPLFDSNLLEKYLIHDKKTSGNKIYVVTLPKVGSYEIIKLDIKELLNMVVKR